MKVKKWNILFLLPLFAVLISAFTIFCRKQGISGHVVIVKGNQMPSPDAPPAVPKPVKTFVYVYTITNISQVEKKSSSPFYMSIKSQLVKKMESNNKGYFKVHLAPGEYSVFIKRGDLFYANHFDQFNNIAPVKVTAGRFSDIIIKIDYDAVY